MFYRNPGDWYTVTMTAKNMHNEQDIATMVWKVKCAYPINPAVSISCFEGNVPS